MADVPARLLGAQRYIGGAIGDLRTISRSVAILPEIARTLDEIRADVRSLEAEVREMHASVERIEERVDDVRRAVRPWHRLRRRG